MEPIISVNPNVGLVVICGYNMSDTIVWTTYQGAVSLSSLHSGTFNPKLQTEKSKDRDLVVIPFTYDYSYVLT